MSSTDSYHTIWRSSATACPIGGNSLNPISGNDENIFNWRGEKPNSVYFLEKSKIWACLEAILKDLKNMTYGRFTVGGYWSVMGLIEDIHDD